MKKKDFDFLLNLLQENAGWQFDEAQYFIVDKKISNFIRNKNYNSVDDLIAELKMGNKSLISQVVEALAFSDTMFFRDWEVFSLFRNDILPKLKEKCRARKQIDIWSLGCSSGQETYSIAMMIDKSKKAFSDWQINIVGSDMSTLSINKAQRGIYNNFEIQTGICAEDILNYFENNNDQWQAKEFLKNMVEFRKYNLLEDIIASSKFEIIFCRNVLRYFNEEKQDEILKRISDKQPQGGYLILGKGEKVPMIGKYYQKSSYNADIYIAVGNIDEPTKRMSNISISAPKDNANDIGMPSFVKPKNLI